jgi:hypothetical protein
LIKSLDLANAKLRLSKVAVLATVDHETAQISKNWMRRYVAPAEPLRLGFSRAAVGKCESLLCRARLRNILFGLSLIILAACGGGGSSNQGGGQSTGTSDYPEPTITFVGKTSVDTAPANWTVPMRWGQSSFPNDPKCLHSNYYDFSGWGQAGYYFPQFGDSSPVGPKETNDNYRFSMPDWLEFNFNPFDPNLLTTFSADKPSYDNGKGRGVYTRGGDSSWDYFKLPDGTCGLSGSVVDEQAAGNANNTVNRIQMKTGVPQSFCMHIVTDNTAGAHNPAGAIIVRAGRGKLDPKVFDPNYELPNPDDNQYLAFDNKTDVYTYRFDNFLAGDFIKIRLNSGSKAMSPGFGGLMFDLACDGLPNAQCGNGHCDIELGENSEICPNDCKGKPGDTPAGTWQFHGPDPGSNYQEGKDRLLIFVAHGAGDTYRGENNRVEGVMYGNKNMHFLRGRSQSSNPAVTVSVWYLKESEIESVVGTNFSVNWKHKPGDHSYESTFFDNVSQIATFGTVEEAGCNDCYDIACPADTVKPGNVSLYAGTHAGDRGNFAPLHDYVQDADLRMGRSGKATIGHKNGTGTQESAGSHAGKQGAFSLVCLEVQGKPQTITDGEEVSDNGTQ